MTFSSLFQKNIDKVLGWLMISPTVLLMLGQIMGNLTLAFLALKRGIQFHMSINHVGYLCSKKIDLWFPFKVLLMYTFTGTYISYICLCIHI